MRIFVDDFVELLEDNFGQVAGTEYIVVEDIPSYANPEDLWIISAKQLEKTTGLQHMYGYVERSYIEDVEEQFKVVVYSVEPEQPVNLNETKLENTFIKAEEPVRNKYMREIAPGVWVDVYDVLYAFNVTDPCLQHLIKKALATGVRGHKSEREDLVDIKDSAIRAVEHYDKFNK